VEPGAAGRTHHVCSIDKDVTDMEAGDAQSEIDWHKSQKVED
jgi:hypothetical protein